DIIRPLLDHPLIEYVGEIGEAEKDAFLGNAYALLFSIDWPEPFGLVMIEAMACGTPVIARRRGSVPEVMEEGVTGFICDTVEEAVRAVQEVKSLGRKRCRQAFEKRFTVAQMVQGYLGIYERLLGRPQKLAA
ncbi:MAG: glycosyltransferase, partial [candidate division NC10 bacterium]